jgi:hypothetical protein
MMRGNFRAFALVIAAASIGLGPFGVKKFGK